MRALDTQEERDELTRGVGTPRTQTDTHLQVVSVLHAALLWEPLPSLRAEFRFVSGVFGISRKGNI